MTDSSKHFCLAGFYTGELSLSLEAKPQSRRQGNWMCLGHGGDLVTLLSLPMNPEPSERHTELLWKEGSRLWSLCPILELQRCFLFPHFIKYNYTLLSSFPPPSFSHVPSLQPLSRTPTSQISLLLWLTFALYKYDIYIQIYLYNKYKQTCKYKLLNSFLSVCVHRISGMKILS